MARSITGVGKAPDWVKFAAEPFTNPRGRGPAWAPAPAAEPVAPVAEQPQVTQQRPMFSPAEGSEQAGYAVSEEAGPKADAAMGQAIQQLLLLRQAFSQVGDKASEAIASEAHAALETAKQKLGELMTKGRQYGTGEVSASRGRAVKVAGDETAVLPYGDREEMIRRISTLEVLSENMYRRLVGIRDNDAPSAEYLQLMAKDVLETVDGVWPDESRRMASSRSMVKVAGRNDLLIKAIEDYADASAELASSQLSGGPDRGSDGLTDDERDKIALSTAKQRVHALVESICGDEAEAGAPAPEALPAPDPASVSLNSNRAIVKVAGFEE